MFVGMAYFSIYKKSTHNFFIKCTSSVLFPICIPIVQFLLIVTFLKLNEVVNLEFPCRVTPENKMYLYKITVQNHKWTFITFRENLILIQKALLSQSHLCDLRLLTPGCAL